MRTINFILNGEQVSAQVAEHQSIVEVLRDRFELFGARESCAQGLCGCCTVPGRRHCRVRLPLSRGVR